MSPCQLSPLAGFGPKFLRAPALQPFGWEAGGGAPIPDTPYRGTRAVDQRPEDHGELAVIGSTRLIGRVDILTSKLGRNRPENGYKNDPGKWAEIDPEMCPDRLRSGNRPALSVKMANLDVIGRTWWSGEVENSTRKMGQNRPRIRPENGCETPV